MRDLLYIACGAGLHDGLNPCIFMTCAIFIALGLWLKSRSFSMTWWCIIFVVLYALGDLVFNFGPGQILVLRKGFLLTARITYFILGAWAFILGVLFFKDWILLRTSRNLQQQERPASVKLFPLGAVVMWLVVVILAIVLSALDTLWPTDKYILILGDAAIAKGQWQTVLPLLVGYVATSMWALWFVWAFISIKNLRPSLFKIVCSSVFFTASSCMVLIFK